MNHWREFACKNGHRTTVDDWEDDPESCPLCGTELVAERSCRGDPWSDEENVYSMWKSRNPFAPRLPRLEPLRPLEPIRFGLDNDMWKRWGLLIIAAAIGGPFGFAMLILWLFT